MSTTIEEAAELLTSMNHVIEGKPIEKIAPLLVVVAARLLVFDADHDHERLAFLMVKFIGLLNETINEMAVDEGFGEPRQ